MQKQLLWVVAFLLTVNVAAAQDEIPCEKSLIVYEHATSQAECFRGSGGLVGTRFGFSTLWDLTDNNATAILVYKIQPPSYYGKIDLKDQITSTNEYVKENSSNWSQNISLTTAVGSIQYRTFTLGADGCFAFMRRKHLAFLIIAWQCQFSFGVGTTITQATVRKLADAVRLKG